MKLKYEKLMNGQCEDDEYKKKSKKHKKRKRTTDRVHKKDHKKKRSKRVKHKSPQVVSVISLSDVEDLIEKSRQCKSMFVNLTSIETVETLAKKAKNGDTKNNGREITSRKVGIVEESIGIISSNSDSENYHEDCASPELPVIEDDLNLEDLMKQKELLQVQLFDYLSDNGDHKVENTKENPQEVTSVPDDDDKLLAHQKGREDLINSLDKFADKHNHIKGYLSEKDKCKFNRHEDLREVINREGESDNSKKYDYKLYKEKRARDYTKNELDKIKEREKRNMKNVRWTSRDKDGDLEREREKKCEKRQEKGREKEREWERVREKESEKDRERDKERRSSEIRRRDKISSRHRSRERSPMPYRDRNSRRTNYRSRDRNSRASQKDIAKAVVNRTTHIVPNSSDEELDISINTDEEEETEQQIIEKRRKLREQLIKRLGGENINANSHSMIEEKAVPKLESITITPERVLEPSSNLTKSDDNNDIKSGNINSIHTNETDCDIRMDKNKKDSEWDMFADQDNFSNVNSNRSAISQPFGSRRPAAPLVLNCSKSSVCALRAA